MQFFTLVLFFCLAASFLESATFERLQSNYEAAAKLHDAEKAKMIAKEMLRDYPGILSKTYEVKAACLSSSSFNLDKTPLQIWQQANFPVLSTGSYEKEVGEVLAEISWHTLRSQLVGATADVWLFICQEMRNIHERRSSDIVLLALSHADLRVQLAALDLIESSPQDSYRQAIKELYERGAHPVLKARILSLATHLGWSEAETMAASIKTARQCSKEEFMALAQYEIFDKKLSCDFILQLARSDQRIKQRLAAWFLRLAPRSSQVKPIYRELLLKCQDEMLLSLLLDGLACHHLDKASSLKQELENLLHESGEDQQLQIKWLLAMSEDVSGPKSGFLHCYQLWQKELNQAAMHPSKSLWPIEQLTTYLISFGYRCPDLIELAFSQVEEVCLDPKKRENFQSVRVALAKAMIYTRNNQKEVALLQAQEVLKSYLVSSCELWPCESLFLSQIVISSQARGYMPSAMLHEAAQQLHWSLLETYSILDPNSAFQMAWKLSLAMPAKWNMPMLLLAWKLDMGKIALDIESMRDKMWLKAVFLSSQEDKIKLKEQWDQCDNRWKELILEAYIAEADETDLPFLAMALHEAGTLRIKAACAIICALNRGYRAE